MKNVFTQFVYHLSMALAMAVIGSICGWMACWPAALLDFRISGVGISGVRIPWDFETATFFANYHGTSFGALAGFFGYLGTLHQLPPLVLLARIPILFIATACGSLVGAPLGVFGILIGSFAAYVTACSIIIRRYKSAMSPTDV